MLTSRRNDKVSKVGSWVGCGPVRCFQSRGRIRKWFSYELHRRKRARVQDRADRRHVDILWHHASSLVRSQFLIGQPVVAEIRRAIAEVYPKAATINAKALRDTSFLPKIVPACALLSWFVHGRRSA